jgi:hypothetical protein
MTYRELADVRRHHNDALGRLREQSEALLYALDGKGPGMASDGAIAQVGARGGGEEEEGGER